MAALVSYSDPNTGATFPQAYVLIDSLTLDKSGKTASATLKIYATQQAAQSGLLPVDQKRFEFRDGMLDTDNVTVLNLYSQYVAAPLDPSVNPVPTNIDDLIIAQGYVIMAHHPQAKVIFAGAQIVP